MNKADLIESLRYKTGLDKKVVSEVLEAILDTLRYVFREDISLELRHFGLFYLEHKKKRIGRDPRSGKRMCIPAVKRPAFKPSKEIVFLDKKGRGNNVCGNT